MTKYVVIDADKLNDTQREMLLRFFPLLGDPEYNPHDTPRPAEIPADEPCGYHATLVATEPDGMYLHCATTQEVR